MTTEKTMTETPFKGIHTLAERTDLRGKRVLVRAGVDAPINAEGELVDDFRVRKSLLTLKLLRAAGARTIVIGHTSRADGSTDASLEPVCRSLNSYIPTQWAGGIFGPDIEAKVEAMREGDILMLENLRFEKGEKENDPEFTKKLAAYGDIYVNDAFSVSHREHASIVGLPQYLPSYAGQLFMQELQHLSMARSPKSPSLFVLGGAKFETKLPLVEKLLATYDRIFIGGALANNFFVARGYEIGTSLVSKMDLSTSPLMSSPKLLLPIDVTVKSSRGIETKKPTEVLKDESILDAGPDTLAMLTEEMRFVATLLWNGPLGDYESGFATYTNKFAEVVSHSLGITIVGGGDTVASIKDHAITDRFTFLSTAGGAMLTFLENGSLVGVDALLSAQQ